MSAPDPPPPHPPTRPQPDQRIPPPPSFAWLWWLALIWIVALGSSAFMALASRSFRNFNDTFLFCAPVAALASLAIAITHLGKVTRRFCGYCGYDRTGLLTKEPCPECGQDATNPEAPGHKTVAHRKLPGWFILLLFLPFGIIILLAAIIPNQSERLFAPAFIGSLALILAAGCWHAWHQVK